MCVPFCCSDIHTRFSIGCAAMSSRFCTSVTQRGDRGAADDGKADRGSRQHGSRQPAAVPVQPARTPQVKIIRRALGISQEDFAARYHVPLGTLRDWEQGRVVPDQASRAYLTVIARDPETVRKALNPPHPPHP
jgi:DNA-binding transcriptional regulator YiaG